MLKTKLRAAALAISGLCLLSACQSQAPEAKNNGNSAANNTAANNSAAAQSSSKADPKVVEEVKEMLAKHDKALNDQNLDAVMETYSNDAKTVMLGTGEGERFIGKDALKNAYTEIFKDYDKGSLQTNCDWKTGDADPSGKLAWMAATCKAQDTMKGAKREYVLNVSAAAVKEDGAWRFVMLHMSNATSGGPPPEVKK